MTQGSFATVFSIKDSRLNAPRFLLQPRRKLPKGVPDFGFKDTGFDLSPAFSEKYSLDGEDEARVREYFEPV